jgi:transcriptional regulator with XRE-family HTH domain
LWKSSRKKEEKRQEKQKKEKMEVIFVEDYTMTGYGVFPERLKWLMEINSTTQAALAKIIKRKPQTVSLYLKGVTVPDIYTVKAISQYYGVDMDWLVGVEKPVKANDVQEVIAYTGLSGDAIQTLHQKNSEYHFVLTELSHLICSESFWGTIQLLQEYRYRANKLRESSEDTGAADFLLFRAMKCLLSYTTEG